MMPFPDYSISDTSNGELDSALLHSQIESDPLITTPFSGVFREGENFTLLFDSLPPAPQQAQCDVLVAAHSSLPGVQDSLVSQIKNMRDSIRLESYILAEYPEGSGNLFSCSISSQDNWAKMSTLDERGLVSYPFTVTTYDERSSYNIVDSADLTAIIGAVSSSVLEERTLAQNYIAAVLAAPDIASAEAAAQPYLDLPPEVSND